MALCCHPLPGEAIVGISSPNNSITIHTSHCEAYIQENLDVSRVINVEWETGIDARLFYHTARLDVILVNMGGVLSSLSKNLEQLGSHIVNLKIINRANDSYQLLLDIEVNDLAHLTVVIDTLLMTKIIVSIKRL